MKVKLGVLENSLDGLRELAKEKIPIKIAYSLTKFISKVANELKIYETQKREILKKYGAKENKLNNSLFMEPEDEHYQIVTTELETLSQIEVEIEFTKIKIGELGNINISAVLLLQLSYLFEDKDE